jgi:Tol biopolymer transport system component/TolB-like protein
MATTSSLRGASFESGDERSAIAVERPDSSPERPGALRIAVLPFAGAGSDPDVASFAEGLAEDILIGLAHFSYLFVVSHNSTARYGGQAIDIRKVGEALRARYVMQGRIRKAGSAIRVNVQVLDAHAGTHLWAETYDRDLAASGMFELQDEITGRVVATIADPLGVLVRSMAAESADKPPESLTPYEVVLRFFLYEGRWSPGDHLVVRAALERAVTVEPGYADAWACLTLAYLDEHRHKFNPRPLALDRALEAARRAVAADPSSQLAHCALAQAHFYRRDVGSFRAAAERAVALNRRSGDALAMMGLLTSLSGDWERGLALTNEAKSLNPHHPGWYHFQVSLDHYRRGEYGEALGAAHKINMPELFSNHLALAIAHGQLGHDESARQAAREMLRLYPEFEKKGQSEHLESWLFSQPEVVEQLVDGLCRAGLEMDRRSKPRPAAEAGRAHSRPAHTGEQDLARTITSTERLVEVARRRKLGVVLALTSLLAAGAGLIFWLRPWTGQHGGPPQAATARITPFTTFSGAADQPAFSPGGDQVAFTWDGGSLNNVDIYVKLIDAGTPLRLTTEPGEDVSPAWSPDGRYLAFIRRSASENGVFIVPALGGAERKLARTEPGSSRLAWSPDGTSLAVVDRASPQGPYGTFLLSLEDGQKQELTSPAGASPGTPEDNAPAFSPDGKILAFIRSRGLVTQDIYLTPVDGGKPRRLTTDERQIHSLAWTADGSQIVFSSNRGGGFSLWRVAVSGGTPERVAVAGQNVYSPAISLRGNRLAYNVSFADSNIWRIDRRAANRQSSPTRLIASTRQDHSPQFSPDGKRIVFVSDRSGNEEIWVCESDGSHLAQLTFSDSATSGTPRWSPDGQQIVFDARPAGNSDIYVMSDQGGKPRPLTLEPSHDVIPSWSRDGRWIYFCSNRSGARQIWKAPAGGGQAVPVTKQGGLEAFESPDGKLLFYTKSRSRGGIWQVPVGGGEERPVPELLGAGYWRYWAVVDDGICFVEPVASARPAIKFYSFATHRVTQIGVLEKDPLHGPPGLTVSPDGRWVLFAQADQSVSDIMLVEDFH